MLELFHSRLLVHKGFSEAKIILTICGRNRRRNQALKMEAHSAPLLYPATVIKMAEAKTEQERREGTKKSTTAAEYIGRGPQSWEGRRGEARGRGGRPEGHTHYIRTRADGDTPLHACLPPQCLQELNFHKGKFHHGCSCSKGTK